MASAQELEKLTAEIAAARKTEEAAIEDAQKDWLCRARQKMEEMAEQLRAQDAVDAEQLNALQSRATRLEADPDLATEAVAWQLLPWRRGWHKKNYLARGRKQQDDLRLPGRRLRRRIKLRMQLTKKIRRQMKKERVKVEEEAENHLVSKQMKKERVRRSEKRQRTLHPRKDAVRAKALANRERHAEKARMEKMRARKW